MGTVKLNRGVFNADTRWTGGKVHLVFYWMLSGSSNTSRLQERLLASRWSRTECSPARVFRRRVWRLTVGWRFAGECGVWVAFALPKRHPLEALRHKGLRRVWHVWRFNWGVYPPPRSGGGSTEYHLPVFVFRPRSKTNASNATHASKPYRIRVSRVAFCLPKRHTCHPNATQTPHAWRTNKQSRPDE